ncbi:lysozyme inhibitor LprI family protein [uncultured Sphingomonas sp.]|uniref:lysozyme inhibitor LprI family protein n=1 Tax=uncultured Sphingomonas sp. TaxID=158754 RepID=UPI002588F10C|nr:lysozyme inhibitor LprI family protein [uncultured Sphingomonas sp.]
MLLSLLLLVDAVSGNCGKAPTQALANACAERSWQEADAAMVREWRATYAAMKLRDTNDKSRGGGFGFAIAALQSQRAWLKLRDDQCSWEGGVYGGGVAQPLARFSCMERMTNERAQALRELRRN